MHPDEYFEANVALVLRQDVLPAVALGGILVRSSQQRVLCRVTLLARATELAVSEPAAEQLVLGEQRMRETGVY